jgi:2,4-dienoyl-CoA reductase-like NADH-dependent reductase (Old Yellow Enzyme family)
VIVSGKINPDLAEQTIADGQADFIALGRLFWRTLSYPINCFKSIERKFPPVCTVTTV